MDMSTMDMGGGSMDMGAGVPGLFYLQQMYWAVIGAAIAAGTVANVYNKIIAYQRLSSGSAKPQAFLSTAMATCTAICREIAYVSIPTVQSRWLSIPSAPLGRVILVLSNLVVVIVLCFYKLNTLDQWSWEDIGYRTGFIAVAQLPLVILLSGKQNIIGALTGLGYERLNWLHRWVARILWLTTTLHMGFWFRSWGRYDYIGVKVTTDPITTKGVISWSILTFIMITTFAPIRRLKYEVFVMVHLVTSVGFLVAVWFHVLAEVRVYVWIPIGFVILDRVLRSANVIFSNLTILHWRQRKDNDIQKGSWANKATFTSLPGNITRITIDKPAISWKAGQHVFVACHSVVPLQSHPFTIASLPSDDKMEFLVRAEKGGTKRFMDFAKKTGIPQNESNQSSILKHVVIEGPYGRMRDLQQFDSVVFFAGSNGVTFTVPLMRSIVADWMKQKSCCYKPSKWAPKHLTVTRRIRFVWVIKSRDQLSWFAEQLDRVISEVSQQQAGDENFDKEVDMSIYVTCDEELVAERTKSGTCCAPPPAHSKAEIVVSPSTEYPAEKALKVKEDLVEVKSIDENSRDGGGCNPDGSCCCKNISSEEAENHVCGCTHVVKSEKSRASQSSSASSSSSFIQEKKAVSKTTPLRIISGRPHPETIIRKVLEEAEGESAVVVCGPKGLRDDVRDSVVSLSDERAVHKGTGAQGIYLHVEGFSY